MVALVHGAGRLVAEFRSGCNNDDDTSETKGATKTLHRYDHRL
jgi:hypothetical protein